MTVYDTILQIDGDEERCSYLPGENARTRYRLIDGCSAEAYQELLEHGWRRFGTVFFRPICTACTACTSLRVDVARFHPNRSMRRTWRRNADLDLQTGRPGVDDERLALYTRYHRARARDRGWPEPRVTAAEYQQTLVDGYGTFGHELQLRAGRRLVAVALFDVLPRALSAVYCYYEPEENRRALGVFSILQQQAIAADRGLPWLYLGYRVQANPSLAYKANYRPHQLLLDRPLDGEAPRWVPMDDPQSAP